MSHVWSAQSGGQQRKNKSKVVETSDVNYTRRPLWRVRACGPMVSQGLIKWAMIRNNTLLRSRDSKQHVGHVHEKTAWRHTTQTSIRATCILLTCFFFYITKPYIFSVWRNYVYTDCGTRQRNRCMVIKLQALSFDNNSEIIKTAIYWKRTWT